VHFRVTARQSDCGKRCGSQNSLQTQETPPRGSGVSRSCTCHWPPKLCGRRIFHRAYCRLLPAGDPFSGPLHWRWLLPGACCSFADLNFRQLVHHWRLSDSNPRAVHASYCFQLLVPSNSSTFSGFWKHAQANNPENRRTGFSARLYRWQFGQKCVPRPASTMRWMGVWHRLQGSPVRMYTQCSN
jgi:hypothetical protein